MEWLPTASAEVSSDAVPPLSGAVPSEIEPSENSTVPDAADGDTVAVNVTLCPELEGLGVEASVVVVDVKVRPHEGNRNEMMRVLQLLVAVVVAWYSCAYQNVQSSLGSILMAE